MLRKEDELISPDEQDRIVENLKAYVTKSISFISGLMMPKGSQVPEQKIDFEAEIAKLDGEHLETLEAFLKDRIENRHWVSPNAAINSALPSTWAGWAGAGFAASFGAPITVPLFVTGGLSILIDQGYHQYTVKQRAPEVMEALKKAKMRHATLTTDTSTDLLGDLQKPAAAAPAPSLGQSLLGIFGSPKRDDSQLELYINQDRSYKPS